MELKFLLLISAGFIFAECYNILGIFPTPSESHHILTSKLMKGLAEAGHNVTILCSYKLKDLPKNGKYNEILLDGFDYEIKHINHFHRDLDTSIKQILKTADMFVKYSNDTFYHPKIKKLLTADQKFDAVILEHFCNDAFKVFSYIYNCPLILLSSIGPNPWVNPTVGNPQEVSYSPHVFIKDFSEGRTFLKRAINLLLYVSEYLIMNFYIRPKSEAVVRQAFPNSPPIYDLFTNVSLVLLNSHTSLNPALPLVPNMIEIGGYFIDPPQKLPQDLQDFLDNAKNGAIYFSMGSTLKSKDIPATKKRAIISALAKLKQKVLWKFEDNLLEKPSNVMIKKWLPQQDILAHPNIKLFITHGGLLSTAETIYNGIPILVIPVYGDQHLNAERVVAGSFGLKLEFNDPNFTEERLSALINELLTNPKYKENAKRRSQIFHDRPQKPMETAIYWVEYVIKYNGAPHLRVAGVKMPLYKYYMVDVIGFLLFSIVISLYGLKLLCKTVVFKFRPNASRKLKIG